MKRPTVEEVKTLRNKTGTGMMECKKALEYSDGIEELAIWYLKHVPMYPPLDWWRSKEGRELSNRLEEERNRNIV